MEMNLERTDGGDGNWNSVASEDPTMFVVTELITLCPPERSANSSTQ